jgi:hypothetical protein
MKVLKDSWEDSGCPKIGEVLREDVSTQRGVKQGDVTSPLFFNLLIDAILRAVETMMEEELGPHEKPTLHFYADDGRIGGGDPDLIQKYLDKCVGTSKRWARSESGKTDDVHPNFDGLVIPLVRTTPTQRRACGLNRSGQRYWRR